MLGWCIKLAKSLDLTPSSCPDRRAVSEGSGFALTNHTTRAFDADLQELARKIGEMGWMAIRSLTPSKPWSSETQ